MRASTARRVFCGAALTAAAATAIVGCGKSTTSPGLMLAFSSDMSVPKDVTAVGLYIRSKGGTVLYNNVVQAEVSPSGQRTVRFPSTFAVLSNGSAASVRVQLVAYGPTVGGNRKALVMRDNTAGVPTDRLGLLRMPLLWINQGSVTKSSSTTPTASISPLSHDVQNAPIQTLADEALAGIPEAGYPGACAEGQTYIGGECRSSDLVPVEEFTDESNPDNPAGSCFSVEKCFAEPTALRYDESGLVDIGGTDAKSINLALITADGFGIKLPDGRFAVSLSAGSALEGYTVTNGKITLSPGVLKVLKSGAATALIATAACEPKSEAIGNCGEWNQKQNTIVPKKDAPAPAFPDAGVGPADGGNPIDAGDPLDAAIPPRDGGFEGGPPPDGGPQVLDAGAMIGRGTMISSKEPQAMGLTSVGDIGYFVRNGQGQGAGFAPSLVKFDGITNIGASAPVIGSDLMAQLPGYHIDDVLFGNYGGDYANSRFLFLMNTSQQLVYSFNVAAGTFNALTLPGGFLPYVFFPSDGVSVQGGPVVFGSTGTGTAAYFYTSSTTYTAANLAGLNVNEAVVAGTIKSAPNTYFVGTTAGRLLECSKGAYPSVSIGCAAKGAPLTGVISDIRSFGGKVYLLVTNPSPGEQNFEGVYVYDGNTITPLATRATHANVLHFEQFNPVSRNHLAIGTGYVYVTTAAIQNLSSRVIALPIGGGPGTVMADSAYAARDIATDGFSLYYTDFGDGTMANNGGVFRVPQK